MNQKKYRTLQILIMVLTAGVGATASADYELNWYTIDGGGITLSSGGLFELSGTVGQVVVGSLSGSSFELGGGFWMCADQFYDCNGNGILDEVDIADGTSQDDNGNGIPDECEAVVITEIMKKPIGGAGEYVEIANLGTADLELYTITDATESPDQVGNLEGVTIAVGEVLVLTPDANLPTDWGIGLEAVVTVDPVKWPALSTTSDEVFILGPSDEEYDWVDYHVDCGFTHFAADRRLGIRSASSFPPGTISQGGSTGSVAIEKMELDVSRRIGCPSGKSMYWENPVADPPANDNARPQTASNDWSWSTIDPYKWISTSGNYGTPGCVNDSCEP